MKAFGKHSGFGMKFVLLLIVGATALFVLTACGSESIDTELEGAQPSEEQRARIKGDMA